MRRELRRTLNTLDETYMNQNLELNNIIPTSTTDLAVIFKRNLTDRGLVVNMIMKYMPYLSQYEGALTSKSSKSDVTICYVIFVFTLFVIFE